MQISVGIGRNVGSKPMHYSRWRKYAAEVEDAIKRTGATVHTHEANRAIYPEATDWEQGWRFWASYADGEFRGIVLLRAALRDIARRYGQWGIHFAFVAGDIIRSDAR